jgi:hypothetical protein
MSVAGVSRRRRRRYGRSQRPRPCRSLLAVGLGDVPHFNRLFRRQFGDTPSWGRQCRAGAAEPIRGITSSCHPAARNGRCKELRRASSDELTSGQGEPPVG